MRILVVIVEAGQDQVADLLDGEVLQRMRQRSDCSILDLWLGVAQQLSENLNQRARYVNEARKVLCINLKLI